MANIDEALLQAIASEKMEDVIALLESGVSPDGLKTQLESNPVDFGDSPLVLALKVGNPSIVAALLGHDAAIYDLFGDGSCLPTDGFTDNAMHYLIENWDVAKSSSMRQIGESILSAGVNINARDSSGITALHRAVVRNQKEACDFLLEHAADPTVVGDDCEQTTPVEDALLLGRMEMLKAMQVVCATSQIPMARLFVPLHTMAASGKWNPTLVELLNLGVDINGLDIRGKRPMDYLPTFGGDYLTAYYAFVAAGAQPTVAQQDQYGVDTLIGEALRTDRALAAAICGNDDLVAKVLMELPTPASSEHMAMVRDAISCAKDESANKLRSWLAQQCASAVLAEIETAERTI